VKVAQCWDDGNVDDVRLVELVLEHGARASFNLNAGLHREQRFLSWKYQDRKEVWKLALGELRSVYAGVTIANHTLTHPWPTKIPAAELEREIVEGRDRLEQLFGQPVLGFAYPFGDYNDAVKDAVRAAGHVYARTCHETATVWPQPDAMEFATSRFHLAADFWQEFERVKAADGVFYFWGHSYEMITEDDWRVYADKLARISADPAVEWVDLPALFGR
jgi:peptidoglycan/xylan/chitin deacetylase (PgdA/CDA1 family)